jgi:hypothetical protein
MQCEFGRLGLRQDARNVAIDMTTSISLVSSLLRKQIDVEITAGKVL